MNIIERDIWGNPILAPVKSKGSDEAYTPDEWLFLIRECFEIDPIEGKIGIDPATTSDNRTNAKTFYCAENSALNKQVWHPIKSETRTCFMNPPFSLGNKFFPKFVEQFQAKVFGEGITITLDNLLFNKYSQSLWKEYASAMLLPEGRINYVNAFGKQKGSGFSQNTYLTYFGKNSHKFQEVFKNKGIVIML